nr:hypothetical protein [Tanacetum cinerariifolium]
QNGGGDVWGSGVGCVLAGMVSGGKWGVSFGGKWGEQCLVHSSSKGRGRPRGLTQVPLSFCAFFPFHGRLVFPRRFFVFVEIDLLSFIQTADPTKVRVGERERDKGEPKLLETTAGRVVPLLPVAPDRSSSDLEASVDKLFDEGGSGEQADQGDFASSGHGVGVQLVDVSAEIFAEDVAPAELQRQKKRKTKVVDAGEPSHLGKKLKGDYEAPGVPVVSGKSQSAVQRLLSGAVQHAEVKGGAIPTLSFVSSSVSTTPEHSSDPSGVNITEAEVDSVIRTFVPIMTNATTATPTTNPAAIAKEKLVSAFVFGGDSSSVGGSHPISGDFSDRIGGDFLVGGIRTVFDPDSNLQRVYLPHWKATNGFCMDDGGVCREMVDEFSPLNFFASIRGMEHDQLFTEFNVDAAHQISLGAEEAEAVEVVCLRDEAQALKERNTYLEKEKSELKIKVIDLAALVKVREQEVANLDAVVTSVKLHNDSLADQVHKLEVASYGHQEKLSHYENLTERLEELQDAQLKVINDKLEKVYADFVDMAPHLKENFYPHLLTTISGRRWLLTHGMELAITKCLHSSEYLSALGGPSGRLLRRECKMDWPPELLMVSNKDASVDTIMNILRLEDNLTKRLDCTYEGGEDVVADVEAVADEGADPFLDVSGAELDVSE